MSSAYQIVVCGSVVPDPLQTLEPVNTPSGPALKNEMMLPAILDPWAAHALYEAAHLAQTAPGSKVWLVSLGPKAKLQQVLMTIAQKVLFEFIALDGPAWRIHRCRGSCGPPGRVHPGHTRAGPLEAAALRGLGIRLARGRRHLADGG